jgi:phosphatidylcholine synthase
MSDAKAGKAPPAVFAWLVHMFTASGAVLALLALVAIQQEQWRLALLWLFVAIVVDGVDGAFARWARTKEQAARIDGDTLDLVVDYLTYVFVPTVFILRAGLVPEGLAMWLAAAILLSSLYLFSRSDMKTHDNYFRGFPALWNMIAFYLFVLQVGAVAGAFVVAAMVVLTFAPVHFVHPFRVKDYGLWLPVLTLLWTGSTCALLWIGWSAEGRWALQGVSIATVSTLLGMGLLRTLRGDNLSKDSRDASQDHSDVR